MTVKTPPRLPVLQHLEHDWCDWEHPYPGHQHSSISWVTDMRSDTPTWATITLAPKISVCLSVRLYCVLLSVCSSVLLFTSACLSACNFVYFCLSVRLSFFALLSVCLSVLLWTTVCLSVCTSAYFCLSVFLYFCELLSVCLSVHLCTSVCLSVCTSVYFCLSVCQYFCVLLFVRLSVLLCTSVCLSVCNYKYKYFCFV